MKLVGKVDPSAVLTTSTSFEYSARLVSTEMVRVLRIEVEVPDGWQGQITCILPGVDETGRVVLYSLYLSKEPE